ncbi:MAG: SNF2-related protein [Sulfurimonas sp.]
MEGVFRFSDKTPANVISRIKQIVISSVDEYSLLKNEISLSWASLLTILPQVDQLRKQEGYKLVPIGNAIEQINNYVEGYKQANRLRNSLQITMSELELENRLITQGFTKRQLRPFQIRDTLKLLSLPNGANFSVPGAGKTTVTFAVHLLTKTPESHLLVIGPKSSFMAWDDVIEDCMSTEFSSDNSQKFLLLGNQDDKEIDCLLHSGHKRFIMSYDKMIRIPHIIAKYLMKYPVHIVLDESHRMKAGYLSQRGAVLLNLASLPIRRDILSGTPMPQSPGDMQSQLDFLWPGVGLGDQISRGESPKNVLGELYVRTTKKELGLKRPIRQFSQISMSDAQLSLYSVLKKDLLAEKAKLTNSDLTSLRRAKKSVMRMLQVSTNPTLAMTSILESLPISERTGFIKKLNEEPISPKMQYAIDLARELAKQGQKTLIWTIFTDTINKLEDRLADLNPLILKGGVPNGDKTDPETREGRIHRFHNDPSCYVMIANPAAVSEGISLHKVCHHAIYLDRSFNSTHYLQSIDRIHRLGLAKNIDTIMPLKN